MSFELIYALCFIAVVVGVGIAYAIRVMFKGRARFERIDQKGGTALLGKSLMELGYWFFQPMARFLVLCHIKPNQISWASLFFGAIAGVCLAFGHFGSGAIFSAISGILDSLDGSVARMLGSGSDAGEILDTTIDRYVEALFLGGLVIYYREIPVLMILSLVALMGCYMVSYSTVQSQALDVDPPKCSMRRHERAVYLILGAALSPVTIPWFEVNHDYPVAIGHPMVLALSLIAVIGNFAAIDRLHNVAKVLRLRDRQRIASTDEASCPTQPQLSAQPSAPPSEPPPRTP